MTRYRSGSPALRQPRPGIDKMLRVACALAAAVAIASLGAFHAWLLFRRLSGDVSFDAIAVLRWSGAAIVLLALFGLHRVRIPLVASRHAAVVWLLAALLHVGVSAPVPLAADVLHVTPGLLVAIPTVSVSVLTVAAVVALARRRLTSSAVGRIARLALWLVRPSSAAPAFEGFAAAFAARPPPR